MFICSQADRIVEVYNSRQMSSDLLLILLAILALMHSVMVYMLPVAVEDGTYLKKHFSGILPISRS
jgi:hypothetical protein